MKQCRYTRYVVPSSIYHLVVDWTGIIFMGNTANVNRLPKAGVVLLFFGRNLDEASPKGTHRSIVMPRMLDPCILIQEDFHTYL